MAVHKATGAGSNLRAFYIVLIVVALGGLAALGYAVMGRGGDAATGLVELEGVEDARRLYEMAEPEILGDPSAPVKIVEFGDYQCPGCGSFATRVKPVLKQRYLDTGRAQLVFYDYPLIEIHAHAFLAARAARCAGDQGKFWEYHDLLFARQSSWAYRTGSPTGVFGELADAVGLDRGAFESCVNSDAHADVVTANRMLGEQLGVNATPTLIIDNRRIADPLDLEEVAKAIEESMRETDG